MSTIGVIVNPLAGRDIRRLASASPHASDSTKVNIIRRVVMAAAEEGAAHFLLAGDSRNLAARACHSLDVETESLGHPLTGTRADTVEAARRLRESGAAVVVVLGGDGTCRDVAEGWPEAPLLALATGTNNVYPRLVDATAAGTAAGLVATGRVAAVDVMRRTKRVVVRAGDRTSFALVDVALIDTAFAGARAVLDADRVRTVIAAVATPACSGLSSIAGRLRPVAPDEHGGVAVELGPGGRRLRVPLMPGGFATVEVQSARSLAEGEVVEMQGPGVLALDGERDWWVGPAVEIAAWVDRAGPRWLDVHQVLEIAARGGLFAGPGRTCHGG